LADNPILFGTGPIAMRWLVGRHTAFRHNRGIQRKLGPRQKRKSLLKIIMVSGLVAVLGASGASQLGLLHGSLAEAFPREEAKQIALSRCETETGAFDRFNAGARDACYGRTLGSGYTEPAHTASASNQLDLRAAAARGSAAFMTR
jgi:hypothetical protein